MPNVYRRFGLTLLLAFIHTAAATANDTFSATGSAAAITHSSIQRHTNSTQHHVRHGDDTLCKLALGGNAGSRSKPTSRSGVYMDALESDMASALAGLPITRARDRSNVTFCLLLARQSLDSNTFHENQTFQTLALHLASLLKQYTGVKARLTVHSADQLSEFENQRVSVSRAKLVSHQLAKHGIPLESLSLLGAPLPLTDEALRAQSVVLKFTIHPRPSFYSF